MPGSLQLQLLLLALEEGLVLTRKASKWGIAKEVGVHSVERNGFAKLQLFPVNLLSLEINS